MIIAKIRKPSARTPSSQPYDDFLWYSLVTKQAGYSTPTEYVTLGYTFDEYPITPIDIGQVYIDNVDYVQVASIASCIAIEKSFYFNVATQERYIHLDHNKRMSAVTYSSLETKGYTNERVWYDENNIAYKNYLNSSVEISDEVDRAVFQKMSFVSNTLVFKNQVDKKTGEGEFEYAFTSTAAGADADIYFISTKDVEEGLTQLTPIYQGFVEEQEITADRYVLKIADKREQLNKKIPNVRFDSTTYTDADDDVTGELIPEGYGELLGMPAFCTNGTITTGDVTYKYATDGTTLTTVYAKTEDNWVVVTPTASSGTDCTFTLASADGRNSSGDPLECKVDATLRSSVNPSAVIADMITRYLGFPFNADYFDFGTWSDESSLLGDIALYMPERKVFFDWIEKLQGGSTNNFIFRISPTGKYKIKTDDITRQIKRYFQYVENVEDSRKVVTNFRDYATDAEILYNLDQESERWKRYAADTYKTETLDTYRLENELVFETLLTSETDAETRAANALKDYKIARPLHYVGFIGIIDCDLLDVIVYDSSICFKGVCERAYAGTVKLKIASYNYDFENEITYFTGYDISDIISKGTDTYSQGTVNGFTQANGFTTVNSSTTTYQPEAG